MIYLIGCVIIFFIISLLLFRRDSFAPSTIYFGGFLVSAIFAYYNILEWKTDLSYKTISCFIIGWLGFLLGDLLIFQCFDNPKKIRCQKNELLYISISKELCFICIIASILITVMLYREGARGAENISTKIDGVNTIAYSFKEGEVTVSPLLTQLLKISKSLAYIFAFVFANNLATYSRIRPKVIIANTIYILPAFFYCIQSYLKGSRFTVIGFIIALFFLYYYFKQSKNGWRYKANIKTVFIVLLLSISVMFLFWFVKGAVGRTSESGIFEYLSSYLGASFTLFDLYIKNPTYGGNETFAGIIESLKKLGIIDINAVTYHEFRFSSNGIMLGNAYSAIRNYYHDYGIIGVFTLSFVLSSLFRFVYEKIRNAQSVYSYSFITILYVMFLYTIMFQFFSDYFYARISIGLITEVMITYLLYILILKTNYKTSGKVIGTRFILKN